MRRTSIAAVVGLAVVAAVVVATQGGPQGRDVISPAPGVFRDPPFSVRLDGPLWRARTLTDRDGAQDFALVASDLPLTVQARGRPGAPVAQVELRIDGRRERLVVTRCPAGRCPVATSVTFVPPLRARPPGDHQVEILVRDPAGTSASIDHGEHVTVNDFTVQTVASVPSTTEGQTIAKLPGPARTSAAAARLQRPALRVLSSARRSGGLAAALGSSRVNVLQIGPLTAGGRRLGVTMLVAVRPVRHDVSATVPGYLPGPGDAAYTTQQVQLNAAVLRDALIDVDLSTGKVIAFEPGPGSRTLSWSPSQAPSPAGAGDED